MSRIVGAGLGFVLAIAAVPAMAAPASLADRIAARDSVSAPADPKIERAEVQALRDEAARSPGLPLRPRLQIDKLYAVALVHNGDVAEAVVLMTDVLSRARAGGLARDPLMVDLLETAGTMESQKGDPEAGLRDLSAAAELARALDPPDLAELAVIEGNIGYSYFKMGRFRESVPHFQASIDAGPPREGARTAYLGTVNNLLSAQSQLGDYAAALATAKFGLAKAAEYLPPDHVGHAYFNMNTAATYLEQGLLDEAEAYYRRAVKVLDAHPDSNTAVRVVLLGKLSDVLRERGHLAEAADYARQSAHMAPTSKGSDQSIEGNAWWRLARLSLDQGQPDLALVQGQRAMAAYAAHGDPSGSVAQTHDVLARAYLVKGDYRAALDHAETAVARFRVSLEARSPTLINAEMLRALILARLGQPAAAWDLATRQRDAIAAQLADRRGGQRRRATAARVFRQALSRLVDVAQACGHPDEAFAAAQLAAFTEISASSLALAARAAGGEGESGRLARQVQDLQEQIDRLETERNLALGKSASFVAQLEQRQATAAADLGQAIAALDARFPRYAELAAPHPVDLPVAQRHLGPGQALLLPVQSDDRMVTLVVTRRGLFAATTPLTTAAASLAVTRLRAELDGSTAEPFDAVTAWQLGRAVLPPPLLRQMAGVSEIALIGSGPIMTLPPGLLLLAPPPAGRAAADPRRLAFAIHRFAFAVKAALGTPLPVGAVKAQAFLGVGAPVLGATPTVLRGRGLLPSALRRGGVADADSLRQLPSLPGAAGELSDLARALAQPGNLTLTGAAATEVAVRAVPLDRFGVVAFATHGLIGGEVQGVDEPALVLTPPPGTATRPDDDGLLTASEIAGLKLDARWVILSACDTGAGAAGGAGGYSGLARGFMQAGARSLLVSLWPVRDDAAPRLTVETVRRAAAGMSEPAALRLAILDLMRSRAIPDAANPATWAPFSLVVQ